jgi:hypothetical protein
MNIVTLLGRIAGQFLFVFFSTKRTHNPSKQPFPKAKGAQQITACAFALRAQYS